MARHGAAFVAGAMIGGLAGAAATLWRAPQPGDVTRSQLGEQLLAHAGPARGVLVSVGDGLNAAGVRLVQGVTIAGRFVEELIDPSPTDASGRPIRRATRTTPTPAAAADIADAPAVDATRLSPTDLDATMPPTGTASSATGTYRPAAMTRTSIPGH